MINFADMTDEDFNQTMNDSFLSMMMESLPQEKAPKGFTDKVMQQITPAIEPVVYTPEYRRQMFWGYVAVGAAMLFAVLMFALQLPFIKMYISADIIRIQNLFNTPVDILAGINKMVSYLKASTTMIIIFAVVGMLLLFEWLLRSGNQHRYSSVQ